MAIRKLSILSLIAAGTVSVFSSQLVAQTPAPVPAPLSPGATDGMILNSTGIELGPGETIISGPPGLQAYGSSLGQTGAMGMSGGPVQILDPAAAMACNNDCFMPCDPGYYGIGEFLYMKHGGGSFSRSNDFSLGDFDWEMGTRITLGRRFDCVDGYEFVYAGLTGWDESSSRAGNLIGSQFVPGAGLNNDAFRAFNNYQAGQLDNLLMTSDVNFTSQSREADFHSLEFNRTYTGWDVIRCMLGLRAIVYNENYTYVSQALIDDTVNPAFNQIGTLRQSVDNFLIGPQVGLETYYPLSRRVFVNSKLKGGIYLDIVDSQTRLFNGIAADAIAGGNAENEDICAMFESSSQLGMHLTPALSVFAGYDIWYMTGVATIEDQLPVAFGRLQGNSVLADDDVFIHGITFGGRLEF